MTLLPQGHTITPSHRAPQSQPFTWNSTLLTRSTSPTNSRRPETPDPPVPPLQTLRTHLRSRVLSGRPRLLAHLALFPFRRGPGSHRQGKGVGVGDLFPPGTSGKCSPEPICLDKMAPSSPGFPLLHGLGQFYSPAPLSESQPEIFEIQTQAQSDAPTRGRSHTLETSFLHRPCPSGGVIRYLRNKKR